jgi:glycyl-tRNA synthetase beta chain
MPDLLFELGVEEIPARFLADATKALAERGRKALAEGGFLFDQLTAWSTPRRLALLAFNLRFDESRAFMRKKGPSEKVAFAEGGQPSQALLGFLRKEDATFEQVERENGYVFIVKRIPRTPARLLAELLPPVVEGIPFPKLMRWGEGDFLYVRPARWALCLWGQEVIPLQLLGVASGNTSHGHRFFGGEIALSHPDEYARKLEESFVLVDPARRQSRLQEESERLAKEVGGTPAWPEGLLEELVNLLEYPTPFRGSFDRDYLELPAEVLTTVMRHHQKQVPIRDDAGSLLPYFLCFRDGPPAGEATVVRGNEQALNGRLEDARLFFRQDQAIPLADRIPQLAGIIFHEKLGTMAEKAERQEELAGKLAERLGLSPEECRQAERASLLAKADLTTAMVQELPELQGIMGREYALLSGEEKEVGQGIVEHYLPRFLGDELPQTTAGSLASMSDRLDTLEAFFALGMEPTGSADPFALRRAAQGLLAILVHGKFPISLEELIALGAKVRGQLVAISAEAQERLLVFLVGRLRFLLEEQGYSFEVISCAIGSGNVNPAQVAEKANLVKAQLGTPELIQLALSAKRIKNILRTAGEFQHKILEAGMEEAEASLYRSLRWARQEERGTPESALAVLLALTPAVSEFFDRVLVMTEDKGRRESRLTLLEELRALYTGFGDFAALPY